MRDPLINSRFYMQLCSHNFESACLHVLATEEIYHVAKDERDPKMEGKRKARPGGSYRTSHGETGRACRT